jgi:AcrR family transcriptional regulator
VDAEPGLRERKKRETRRLISDVASGLFMQRGFDNVTVAEVAEAADVSTKTVFNYFPRKEDLFLDRLPEAMELVASAVRGRAAGESPLDALRQLFVRLIEERHPLGGVGEGFQYFWRVVLDSPALLARIREFVEELEELVAQLLAEAEGVEPSEPRVRLGAALVVAAYRTVYLTGASRLFAGGTADAVAEQTLLLLNRSFDAVGRALNGF